MRPSVRTILVASVGLLLCAGRVDASSITITNIIDTPRAFFTTVVGSFGLLPDIHVLVDIPGTPWDSSSIITEAAHPPGPLPDVLGVSWTIQHLLGPNPGDVNPNPNEPLTLSLPFIPTAAGFFGFSIFGLAGTREVRSCDFPPGTVPPVFTEIIVPHPSTAGPAGFDHLCLNLFGFVTTDLLGGLNINSYTIEYFAQHCDRLDPVTGGCPPLGPPIPEPAALVLLASGFLLLAAVGRKRGWADAIHAVGSKARPRAITNGRPRGRQG